METQSPVFLLADDDGDDRELFVQALAELDKDIVCYLAEDGSQVFELLEEHPQRPPHIIFLDVNMPRINGWECLSRLKHDSAHSGITVIMYSTSSTPAEVERALTVGARCFVAKPYDYEDLKRMLQTTIANMDANLGAALNRLTGVKCAR